MRIAEKWLAIGLIVIIGNACTVDLQRPNSKEFPKPEIPESVFIRGEANLYLDEETALILERRPTRGGSTQSVQINKVLADIGATSIERIFPDAGEFEPRSREMGLHRWYKVKFNPSVSLDQAGELFLQVKGVLNFERNLKTTAMALELPFNDPRLQEQWQYYNPGNGNSFMVGADMDVFAVWKYFTTGNPTVKVAIVDSGVQLNHEDLAANADAANSFNFITQTSVIQPQRHGTHVAGTIAAVNNNSIGVSGMAGGDAAAGIPGVKLMSLQTLNDDGIGSGSSEQAIKWAADHGAVLCNNSWGFDFEDDKGNFNSEEAQKTHEFYLQPNEGEFRSSLKSAIDYFNTYAGKDAKGNQTGPMAGGLVIFSAGNENKPWGSPACYPGVVAVGAIGPHGHRAYYSNYGDWVDIAATGGDAYHETVLSTFSNNEYGSYQGTSMACPHITGVAALLVSYFGSEGFTREMLLERLLGGINPLVSLNGQPIGNLSDAYAAFTMGQDMTPAAVNDLKAEANSNSILVSWSITSSSDAVPAAGYLLFSGTSEEAVKAAVPKKPGGGVTMTPFITTTSRIGEFLSQRFDQLKFETTYYFKVIGYDVQGHYAEPSSIVSLITPANQAPQIKPVQDVNNLSLKNFETISIDFVIFDPDGHSVSAESIPATASEKWIATNTGYRLIISGQGLDPEEYTTLIKATDSYGATSEFKLTYKILPNQPPVAVKEINDVILGGQNDAIDITLSEFFSDPDGESLSYDADNTSPSVLHIAVTSGILHITPIGFGASTVTVYAIDARGEKASITFRVLVRQPGIEYQAYPNPVSDYLHIATGMNEESTDIKVVSATGSTVWEGTVNASAFNPAQVDFTSFAPGQYGLILKFGGKEYHETIVKDKRL